MEQAKLSRFKNIDLIKARNLAKFKNIKYFFKYKKSITNLIKFKVFKEPSFLSSITKLAYTNLR